MDNSDDLELLCGRCGADISRRRRNAAPGLCLACTLHCNLERPMPDRARELELIKEWLKEHCYE